MQSISNPLYDRWKNFYIDNAKPVLNRLHQPYSASGSGV